MKESEYKLRIRIKDLETENQELRDRPYGFRQSCVEIFNGCTEVLSKGGTTVSQSWLFQVFKRNLMP